MQSLFSIRYDKLGALRSLSLTGRVFMVKRIKSPSLVASNRCPFTVVAKARWFSLVTSSSGDVNFRGLHSLRFIMRMTKYGNT